MGNFIEAGFKYTDAGASAMDNIDLKVPTWTSGDTVNTRKAFVSQRSCGAIRKAALPTKVQSGNYYISVGNGKRHKVYCDFHTKGGPYTMYACKGCSRKEDECKPLGLRRIDDSMKEAKKFEQAVVSNSQFGKLYSYTFKNNNYYVCTSTQGENHPYMATNVASHDKITRAEVGKFVIQFHAKDKSGNTDQMNHLKKTGANCQPAGVFRTVIVRDTLPPVIALTFNKKLIHVSKGGSSSINGQANPAVSTASKPLNSVPLVRNSFPHQSWEKSFTSKNHFMAESTQAANVNAWIVGAAASAVTGVALLAYGMRQ